MNRWGFLSGATALVCAAVLCMAAPAWASSATYYVSSSGLDSNSCTSSSSACATITGALAVASAADVSTPTVYVSGTINDDSIQIDGAQGFVAVTIAQDPGGATAKVTGGSDTNSLFVIENDVAATFSGLQLDGLSHSGNNDGGAIDDDSSGTVTVTGDSIDAQAWDNGGAIAVMGGGALNVTDDTFDYDGADGSGSQQGGAIWVDSGTTVDVTDSNFEFDSSAGDGGAIAVEDSGTTLNVLDSTFSEAEMGGSGGAIADDGASSMTVTDSTFYRNMAGVDGGAIFLASTAAGAEIVGSTFDGNTGDGGGFLGSINPSTYGNNVFVATGASAPTIRGDVFSGTCYMGTSPVDDGYNAGYDGSCLSTSPSGSPDVQSRAVADLSGLGTEAGAAAGAPPTVVVGAANPAAGLIPNGTGGLCSTTDEAGVTSSGACNVGASQVTTPRPVLYVAHGGSDTGDCSIAASPCATVAYAVAQENQYELNAEPTVYPYSDPTVYVSGDINEENIPVSEDAVISQYAGPDAAPADIDGTGLSNSDPLFDITGGSVSINGITIENAPGGGAVVVDDPGNTVTFDDDVFSGNSTADNGGAIANISTGIVEVRAATFSNDSATDGGGAIWVGDGGTVDVDEGSNFSQDNARFGGAIAVGIDGNGGRSDTLEVNSTTFTADAASDNGGAIDNGDNSDGTVHITDAQFADDTAASDGGAIDNGDDGGSQYESLSIGSSLFDGDTAQLNGGAIDNGDGGPGSALIENSSFHGDTAVFDGGAIDNGDRGGTGTLTVDGVTFTGDQATGAGPYGDGGAIDNGDTALGASGVGDLAAVSSTFDGDTAPVSGDLINDQTPADASIAGDLFDGTCATGGSGTITDRGYNAATDGTCIAAGVSTDAVDASVGSDLGAPGGAFETVVPVWGDPAIDLVPTTAPSVSGFTLCPTTDILGNGGPDGNGSCDAGAVQEYTPLAPTGSAADVTATAGVGEATVTWTPPSLNDAGGAISGFTVTPHNVTTGHDETRWSTTGDVDSLLVTGLTDGDSYTFTVVTNNSAGSGPASSASSAVTVQSPPAPPTNTSTTPTNTGTASTPTTTPTPTSTGSTSTPTATPPKRTTSTSTATLDDQKLTLVTPLASTCLAPSKSATIKLTSSVIPHSKKAKLKFVSALFTLGRKQPHIGKRSSLSETFKLKGMKKGRYAVKVVVSFHQTLHGRTTAVKKTIAGRLSVC